MIAPAQLADYESAAMFRGLAELSARNAALDDTEAPTYLRAAAAGVLDEYPPQGLHQG